MLAVVIPYYKLTFFEATLQSLANQTDKRFKVYIGNDASLEDCTDLLERYKGKIEFDYFYFNTNYGSSSLTQQWERCIALVKSEEWLMVLGDDDFLESNVVASFYKNLEEVNEKKCQVVRFASRYIDENQNPLKGYIDYFHPKLEKEVDSFYRNFIGQSRSSLSEHIFSKKTYKKFGFHDYPLAWHSDDRAWLEFAENKPIFTINEALVEVRVTSYSITGKKDNWKMKIKAKNQFYEFLVKNSTLKFTKIQKENLLLQYGVLLQNQKPILYTKVLYVFIELIKLGAFYNALRFLRRIAKAQY
jgi:hypothetical protein